MRENWNLRVVGPRVILMPYLRRFVPKYHEWMQDEYILAMTGSEPLSLEEEYEMQEQWRVDKDKCTFIIHTRDLVDGAHFMIGDINLFLSSTYEDDDEECVRPGTLTGEINVMIAEAAYRGKGLATEAILLMMHYGAHALGIKKFMCKIHESNAASIHMFKRIGFKEVKYVKAFQEYQLDLSITSHEGVPQELLDCARGDFCAFVDALIGSHGVACSQWDARNTYGDESDAEDALTPKHEGEREFSF